jgi:PAS domain S-box-containing protein
MQNASQAFIIGDHPTTILLVDDEPLILSAYRRSLKDFNGRILMADGPEEGLRILEAQPIDVVVADYRMPRMNGDAFLERVRERWPQTVRLLVTACTDVHIVEDVVRRGEVYRFLTKPCQPDKLKDALADAIAQANHLWTEQRKSQRLVLDLHSFRHLFQSSPDPMMVANLMGDVVEVNDAFVSQGGGEKEDALSARPHLLSGRKLETSWQEIQDILTRCDRWSGEAANDGEYSLLAISLLRNDLGDPYAYVATERDITARHKLEEQTRAAQYEVVFALARLAEFRDPETGAHLERMRRYSQILAQQLSKTEKYADIIDDEYVEAIFYSSPVHDIGKVGIPDAILLKPGPLTADERTIMQSHATIGAEVLSVTGDTLRQKSWLSMARTIALQHHEKVDGTGYPKGLVGDEIDLSARIVALADAYDAITSRRVYKDPIAPEVARKRIIAATGSHFDPDLVQAFLAVEEQFLSIRKIYRELDDDAPDSAEPAEEANSSDAKSH